MKLISRLWMRLKHPKKLRLGPISLSYRLERTIPVSNNTRRRIVHVFRNLFPPITSAPSVSATHSEEESIAPSVETALIVGVGPGFGYSVARKLVAAGFQVALSSRNAERLDPLVAELKALGGSAQAYGCDAIEEKSVMRLMSLVSTDFGVPQLVIYSLQEFCPGRAIDVDVPAFEFCWRQNCLGGFIIAREAARRMMPVGHGTIILVGSTSSLIGRADHLNLAVGRFGLRALSQVLSREVWPNGIHVAHLVIDADIQENDSPDESHSQTNPEHISDTILMLHRQPKTAWTSEIDIRPWNEKFWEHC